MQLGRLRSALLVALLIALVGVGFVGVHKARASGPTSPDAADCTVTQYRVYDDSGDQQTFNNSIAMGQIQRVKIFRLYDTENNLWCSGMWAWGEESSYPDPLDFCWTTWNQIIDIFDFNGHLVDSTENDNVGGACNVGFVSRTFKILQAGGCYKAEMYMTNNTGFKSHTIWACQ